MERKTERGIDPNINTSDKVKLKGHRKYVYQ